MKKLVAMLVLYFVFSFLFADDYSVEITNKKYYGTYISESFINIFSKTTSYITAMKNKDETYDVISVNKDIVYSNLEFHDQYAINNDIVKKFSFTIKNDIVEVIDDNRKHYKKVSDTTDYYTGVRIFLMQELQNRIGKRLPENVIINRDTLLVNGEKYTLVLDTLGTFTNIDFFFYSEKHHEKYIGLSVESKSNIIYEIKTISMFEYVRGKTIYEF